MTPALWYGLLGVEILLALAAVIAGTVLRLNPTEETSNVCVRIKTWFYIISVFTGLFFLPVYGVCIVLAGVLGLALWEIHRTLQIRRAAENTAPSLLLTALATGSMCCACMLYARSKESFFFVVVLTQLNDIFQYLWGKSCGRHLILPRISPSKTWEGFLGGVITSMLAACVAGPCFWELNAFYSLLAGGLMAVCGFLGDATVSAFKRRLKIKDMGTLLPGHGGILDRIDSLLYVFPLAFVYLKILAK